MNEVSQRKALKEFYNGIAKYQLGFYNRRGGFVLGGLAEFVQNIVLKMVTNLLVNRLHSHDKLLDVGCGRGRYLSVLKKAGFTGVGLDFSLDMLKIARSHINHKGKSDFSLIQSTADFLPFRDKSFRCAICIDVLHHFTQADRKQVILELARVVKSDGEIVIEIKNQMNIVYLLLSKFNPAPLAETVLLDELIPFLKSLGFDTIETRGVLFPISILSPLILIQASHRKQSFVREEVTG